MNLLMLWLQNNNHKVYKMTECNISTVLFKTKELLTTHGIEEANLQAELLIMKALNVSRAFLNTHPEKRLADTEQSILRTYLGRRISGEPWPYISGNREFFGLNIKITHGVFIPRPETESLVELVLKEVALRGLHENLHVADVCTGSGAIAVALAYWMPGATVYATDISTVSLATATENIKEYGLLTQVLPLNGHLLCPLPRTVDIIVSHPPYIKTSDLKHLQREVLFEPTLALDGGEHGMDVILQLMRQISNMSRMPRLFVSEILPETSGDLVRIARQILPAAEFKIHTDYAGLDRFLVGKFS